MIGKFKIFVFGILLISPGIAFSMVEQPSAEIPKGDCLGQVRTEEIQRAMVEAKEIVKAIPEKVIREVAVQIAAQQDGDHDEKRSRCCCSRLLQAISCRIVAKTITWRCLGTLTTALITYLLTRNIGNSLAIGGLDLVSKLVLYYLHERVWECISWGKKNRGVPSNAP